MPKTLFVNSGSEGFEAALMIASAYWSHLGRPRSRVVGFARGYQGSTLLTRSMSTLPRSRHLLRSPVDATLVELPLPPKELRRPESAPLLLAAFERALYENPEDPPAAVVVEPFLNVGGAIVLPPGFLRGLHELCDATGTLLIVDEVFTAYGRSGRMFASLREDVAPDILVSSKGLSGGYVPIAAVNVQQRIHDTFGQDPVIGGLRYGHTTSGHSVACAAALATLDVVEKGGLVERAEHLGGVMLDRLAPLALPRAGGRRPGARAHPRRGDLVGGDRRERGGPGQGTGAAAAAGGPVRHGRTPAGDRRRGRPRGGRRPRGRAGGHGRVVGCTEGVYGGPWAAGAAQGPTRMFPQVSGCQMPWDAISIADR